MMRSFLSGPRCRAGAHGELGGHQCVARRGTGDGGGRQRPEAPSGATLNFPCPKAKPELRLPRDSG